MALKDDIAALPVTPQVNEPDHITNHVTIHAAAKDHDTRITANATAVAAKYTKPSTGIPSSDLAVLLVVDGGTPSASSTDTIDGGSATA